MVFLCLRCDISLAQNAGNDSLSSLLTRAYSLLSTNPDEAIMLFKRAVEIDPSNVPVLRQLGYAYESRGEHENALEELYKAESVKSSDIVKLQIGYILAELHRVDDANRVFEDLRSSPNNEIRQKANDAIVSPAAPSFPRWWTHVYAVPYYDTRWSSWFYNAFVRRGYYLTDDKKLSAFGIVSISGDNRSSGGTVPQVFSDNSLIVAAGFRLKPFNGFLFDVQQGIAFDLIDRGSDSKTKGDFRATAIYANGIYAPFTLHDDFKTPFIPFVDLYSSFGYYSRYRNGIGYLQARAGVRAIEVSHSVADIYGRLDLVRDTEKEFFNNLAEVGAGIRFTPDVDFGLHIQCEYHRGMYWLVSDRPVPYDLSYNSVRLFLIFERMF